MKYIKMSHGSQLGSITNDDTWHKLLVAAANEGDVIYQNDKYLLKDTEGNEREGELLARKIQSGPFEYIIFITRFPEDDSYQVGSFYPFISKGEGTEVEVEITEIMEENVWTYEGVIGCDLDGKSFYFFDPFYYTNKSKYKVGEKVKVELSGLIFHAQGLTDEDIHMKVDRSIEQRQAIGMEIEYDDDGNLKPVIFNTSKLNSFIPSHEWYGDMEYQSEVKQIDSFDFYGEDVHRIVLEIVKENGTKIPLNCFTREGNIQNRDKFGVDLPLRGMLMLQGTLVE